MRIGIDVRESRKGVHTGLRTILYDLLRGIDPLGGNDLVFFGNQHTDVASLPAKGADVIINEKNTLFWDQFELPLALKREKIDVFFTPYIKTPIWRVCPYVNIIADVIPLSISRFKGLKAVMDKAYFFAYAFISGHRCEGVITLSEDAKTKINRIFRVRKNKIKVAYPAVSACGKGPGGASEDEFTKRYDLTSPYILYAGNFKPHKNIPRLIEAYCLLPEDVRSGTRLMLVGGSETETRYISAIIDARGMTGRIIPVTNVKHDDVLVFMREADIFVFPSLAEGFGIPPVEAMCAGVPVASSKAAPMPEALGDAAVYFDPLEPADMAAAMLKLLTDQGEREKRSKLGLERAKFFDAAKMSKIIFDAILDAGRFRSGKAFVLDLGGIGNTILIYPLIRAMIDDGGYEVKIAVAERSVKSLFTALGIREEDILLLGGGPLGLFRTVAAVRKERIGLAVAGAYTNWMKAWLLFAACGIKNKIAYAPKAFSFFFDRALNDRYLHEYEVYKRFAGYLGLELGDLPDIRIKKDTAFAEKFFLSNGIDAAKPVVALHLGSGAKQASFRRWPVEKFAALAKMLEGTLGARLIVVGGPGEEPLSESLAALGGNFVPAAGKTDLYQLAAIIDRCDIVVGNDSGIMHFAAALGRKVVAVFGPTDYRITRPLSPAAWIVRKDLPCSPCYKSSRVKCSAMKCFTDVSPEEVFENIKALLERKIN